jgi:hypothetical protein
MDNTRIREFLRHAVLDVIPLPHLYQAEMAERMSLPRQKKLKK